MGSVHQGRGGKSVTDPQPRKALSGVLAWSSTGCLHLVSEWSAPIREVAEPLLKYWQEQCGADPDGDREEVKMIKMAKCSPAQAPSVFSRVLRMRAPNLTPPPMLRIVHAGDYGQAQSGQATHRDIHCRSLVRRLSVAHVAIVRGGFISICFAKPGCELSCSFVCMHYAFRMVHFQSCFGRVGMPCSYSLIVLGR